MNEIIKIVDEIVEVSKELRHNTIMQYKQKIKDNTNHLELLVEALKTVVSRY